VQAITVRDRAAGAAGLTLSDIPHPHAAENDVIVRVCAAGFTPGELDWPGGCGPGGCSRSSGLYGRWPRHRPRSRPAAGCPARRSSASPKPDNRRRYLTGLLTQLS
jgi:hypothetical protein